MVGPRFKLRKRSFQTSHIFWKSIEFLLKYNVLHVDDTKFNLKKSHHFSRYSDIRISRLFATRFFLFWYFSVGNLIWYAICIVRYGQRFIPPRLKARDAWEIKGLWSVATVSLSQPWVKNFVCSNAHATAWASPSIGAYLDFAPELKRDPARHILQPPVQHARLAPSHSHTF